MSTARVICAGFGGQGVMSMGQLLTYAGMLEEKEVSWLPSYGPEMRGGTANCSVTISDMPVGSPVITDDATCAIVMNLPSLDKFENDVVAGGKVLVNSSLIEKKVQRTDVDAYYIPANEIALELGNPRVARVVRYIGKSIPTKFVLGYGLDFDEKGRNLGSLYVLRPE